MYSIPFYRIIAYGIVSHLVLFYIWKHFVSLEKRTDVLISQSLASDFIGIESLTVVLISL